MPDVLVIGHVVKDRFPDDGDRQRPGGTAYYASIALRSLGAGVRLVTRLAAVDRDLQLAELRAAGVETRVRPSVATTEFVHAFPHGRAGERVLSLARIAAPFAPEDLAGEAAAFGYAGPLTAADVPAATLEALRAACGRVALDLQGLVRVAERGGLRLARSEDALAAVRLAHIVKADIGEATALTGEAEPVRAARALAALGPDEVIVTMSDRGSVLLAGGAPVHIPALRPARFVDATGCGDTYLAGYVFARGRGDDPPGAARFAAAAATVKLEQQGALRRPAADVEALLAREPLA